MALRVIELDIDESLSGETRVEEIALVLQPAIETEFMYFNEQGFAEVGERGGINPSQKAPKSDTPNPEPKGEGTAKGDASSTRGAEVTQRVEDILKKKSDDFNERYKDKLGYGVNLGMLKSVYQRGVGAYNVSHSPAVRSAEQWALARVNAFLYLVKEGRPENPKYKGDNDLLPTDHPKKEKMSVQKFESYSDYPEAVKNNAKRVLKYVEENGWGSCGTEVGKQRANQLAKGEPISIETITRMYSYLSRHKADLETSKSFEDGCGYKMYMAWGGPEALTWAERKINQVKEEMGYDVSSLEPWSQTSGMTIQNMAEGNLDVFGYMTRYFQICPGAQATFQELISSKPDEDTIGMIRSAAIVADRVFQIEDDVLRLESANGAQLKEAIVLVDDFKDIISEVEKIQGREYNVDYMDGHIETIKSFVNKEELSEIYDCGCDCDGCDEGDIMPFPNGGLYFGEYMIDGMPVFQTQEEAEAEAENMGCSGSHIHIIDGKEYYMPCAVHSDTEITDEVEDLIEDRGVEYEDLIKQGWVLEEINDVDPEELKKKLSSKFNKMSKDKFYSIITTPGEASVQDLGNKRFRYVYMTGFGADIIPTSRSFCKRMLGGRQFVFRYEDIQALSAILDSEPDSYKIIPRPKGTSVDLMSFKGGANCRHFWLQLVFSPGIAGITAEQTPQAKITNNKRKMIEESDYQIPGPNQSGQVNPPVDYGSRSPQSVGMSKQDFRRSSSQIIIVDVDDTLVSGSKGIKKTIDYVNKKWDSYRIVIVSGRQASRTEETKRQLDQLGVKWDDIFLSDFPQGPNASNAFKEYKAKWLKEKGYSIVEAIDNSSDARRAYSNQGIKVINPTSLRAIPDGFLQGFAIFRDKDLAREWSQFCGCGGSIEPVDYMGESMFQACSYKKQQMSAQFSVDQEKRMIYSPAMKPGILIPRLDEITREKYFVTFKPETIEKMAQRFLIEKRTDKTNYEHSDLKYEDVYLVESWIVDSEMDKAYGLGFTKQQIPLGTWMVGFRVDNDEVWEMVKQGKIKGVSIEGNFEYKFSASKRDDYLLQEIINILNQIN